MAKGRTRQPQQRRRKNPSRQCLSWQGEINRLTRRLNSLQNQRVTASNRNDVGKMANLDLAIDNTYNRIDAYEAKIKRNCGGGSGPVTTDTGGGSSPAKQRDKQRTRNKVAQIASKRKLTQSEIAYLWVALGGPVTGERGYRVASAVAMAESGGDADAGNYCCHGLWAFNVSVGVTSMKCALSIICSTRKAISMSKEMGWQPWEAYTNGMYQRFMNTELDDALLTSLPVIPGMPIEPGAGVNPGDVVDGVGDVAGAISDIVNALTSTEFWLRVGKVVLGVLLLAFAANALLKSLLGIDVIGTASGALSKGAVKSK